MGFEKCANCNYRLVDENKEPCKDCNGDNNSKNWVYDENIDLEYEGVVKISKENIQKVMQELEAIEVMIQKVKQNLKY